MAYFDVFNGDADGICALTQLRLAEPRDARLVTGVKRDIQLVSQIEASAGDQVTILDISLDKNRDDVQRLLDQGVEIFYVDHHYAGEIPAGPGMTAIINESADMCTSLLVNGRLKNRYVSWAITGAYGDNLSTSAEALAGSLELTPKQLRQLDDLGTYLNYNGYGESIADLHFPPDELFRLVSRYESPFDFIHEGRAHFDKLADGYTEDMGKAASIKPESASTEQGALFVLPNEAWARRVSGVYSNNLTNQFPDRAHAVLTAKANSNYLVSVRAPLNRKKGADVLCRAFASGGGRAAAAGINELPTENLPRFTAEFLAHSWGQ